LGFRQECRKENGDRQGDEEAPEADSLKKEVEDLGLDAEGLDIEVEGDKVRIKGRAKSQEAKEKVVLALGNVAGVAQGGGGHHHRERPRRRPSSTRSKPGDNLSAIAQKYLGKASRYPEIFEANKPMLKDPDKIYPGQMLRIPVDD
jgi:nucleoid-associated protein YgaU